MVAGRKRVSFLAHFKISIPSVIMPAIIKKGKGIIPSEDEVVPLSTTHSVPSSLYPVGHVATHVDSYRKVPTLHEVQVVASPLQVKHEVSQEDHTFIFA